MLFNSYEFILFFLPLVFSGFFTLYYVSSKFLSKRIGKKIATGWLVLMSFAFYGYWDYKYVPLLFASILFNYIIGRLIEEKHSKKILSIGIIGNVILLGYYKYTAFFMENANYVMGWQLDIPTIILPLGISFFTFTQSAYLIDAYRGETKSDSFLTYCEFVTIFPHLIAGPIINHREMIPQFIKDDTFRINSKNIAVGLTIFTLGLFKKVFIADTLSPWVAELYQRTESLNFIEGWYAAISYTLQLYFDFSGYSEMAIGLALLFNMKFPINFNSPYQATSIIDFWRRWHMTLGLWVRNYLYIPMGGNRHGEMIKMRNLLLSMLIIGFWHGAGWTFVLWGGTHGILLVINHQWRRLKIELPHFLCLGLTFLSVMVCWIFFRAETFSDGFNVLAAMLDTSNLGIPFLGYTWNMMSCSFVMITSILVILLLIVFFVPNPVNLLSKHEFKDENVVMRAVIIGIIFTITLLRISNSQSEFLYFQF